MDICALLLLSCLKERTIVLRDRDLLALTGHLNDALVVVSLSYPTSVALVRSANDDDHFAYFGVTSHSVLAGDGLAAGGTFHKLFSQQNDILTVHHEETIRLHEVLVPEKEVVLKRVLDGSIQALVLPRNALHHRVMNECVALSITTPESATTARSRLLLPNIDCLNLVDLALLVDNFDVILMHLQDQASVLRPVVVDQIDGGLVFIIFGTEVPIDVVVAGHI